MEKFKVLFDGGNTAVRIEAKESESFLVRAGAMLSMDDVFSLKLKAGGFKKTFGRMWSGNGAVIQEFTAKKDGEIVIGPSCLGDIKIIEMTKDRSYRLGQNAFLFSYGDINLDIKKGMGIMSGEGLLQMVADGTGTLGISAYGAIYKKQIEDGKVYIVDTNHIVLFDSDMKYSVESISTGFTSMMGGEGYVIKFTGPGEIWIQSKNPSYLANPGT